ncbi:MAG: hypothetical protein ACREQI_00365 [Candidatus Binataceae bacterium]
MKLTTLIAAAVLAFAMLAPAAMAQENPPPQGAHPAWRAMFKARMDACDSKKVGDSCSFTLPDGKTMNGACREGHHGKLICLRPRRHRQMQGGAPHPVTPGE